MALPPSDIPPSELVAKLLQVPFTSEEVDFPRNGADGEPVCSIWLRVLSAKETQEAANRARKSVGKRYQELKDIAGYLGIMDPIGNETACETLAAATFTDPDCRNRAFTSGSEVADLLTTDEIASLYASWLQVQGRFAGDEMMTEAEVTAWVERLKEGLHRLPFSRLSSRNRDQLLQCLAQRSYTLSRLEKCPPERLPTLVASIAETWRSDTTWSSEPLASSTTHAAIVDALSE